MSQVIVIKIIVFIQCLYIGIVALSSIVFSSSSHEHLALHTYFSILISACFFLSLFTLRAPAFKLQARPQTYASYSAIDIGSVVLVTICAAVIRFRGLEGFDLWFDEDMQISKLLRSSDPLAVAIVSFQSPIDYFCSLLANRLVGTNLFAVRVTAATLGTLTAPLLFFFCRYFVKTWIAMFAGLVYVVHPFLLAYAREGRPYMGAIFLFTICLHWLWWARNTENERAPWVGLLAAQITLLYQLSVLPALLLFFLGICLSLSRATQGSFLKKYWVVSGLAVLLWLPYLGGLLLDDSKSLKLVHLSHVYGEFVLYTQSIFSVLGVSVFAFPLVVAALYKNKREGFAGALLLLAITYPIFMFVIAKPLFPIPIAERYVLLYGFVFIVSSAIALQVLEPRTWTRTYRSGVALAVGVLVVLFLKTPSKKIAQPYWAQFFSWIKTQETETGGIATIFSPTDKNEHEYRGFVGTNFFYTPEIKAKVILQSDWDVKVRQSGVFLGELQKNRNPQYVYFLSYGLIHRSLWEKFPIAQVPGLQIHYLPNSITLLRLETKHDALEKIKHFFEVARATDTRASFHLRYKEMLLGLAVLQKKCSEALTYADIFQEKFQAGSEKRNQLFLKSLFMSTCDEKIPGV